MRAQERRTNDDPILKEKEESLFFSLKIEERSVGQLCHLEEVFYRGKACYE